jgi:hypothetical protein
VLVNRLNKLFPSTRSEHFRVANAG